MIHPTTELLMLLADRELAGPMAEDIRGHAESCPACRAMLARIEDQRTLVRQAIEASLVNISFEGFSNRVIQSTSFCRPLPLREKISVWVREQLAERRRVWVPSIAFAAAATIAALVIGLAPASPVAPLGGSSVVKIQAASSAIVFDIPSADGLSSTAVVWINDQEPDGGSGS